MTSVNTAGLRQHLPDYLNQAVVFHDTIHVNTEDGNAILLSEEEYNSMRETLYLLSVPGMKERLLEGLEIPIEECDDFAW